MSLNKGVFSKKIGAVKAIFYLTPQIKLSPYFTHFHPIRINFNERDFNERDFQRTEQNVSF